MSQISYENLNFLHRFIDLNNIRIDLHTTKTVLEVCTDF